MKLSCLVWAMCCLPEGHKLCQHSKANGEHLRIGGGNGHCTTDGKSGKRCAHDH